MKPASTNRATTISDPGEDSILRRLTREDRAKLSMDAWEPSLLRHLMKAQDKLPGADAPSGGAPAATGKKGEQA